MLADQADHVFGVDTHRDSHSAAILAADTAVVQGQTTIAANERGITGGCCASRVGTLRAVVHGRSRERAATARD